MPAVEVRTGEKVLCTLLEEKSKRGKWRATTKGGAVGTVEPEGQPEDIAPGQEVELVVKNTAALGQDWTFTWPKKTTEQPGDAKGRKR